MQSAYRSRMPRRRMVLCVRGTAGRRAERAVEAFHSFKPARRQHNTFARHVPMRVLTVPHVSTQSTPCGYAPTLRSCSCAARSSLISATAALRRWAAHTHKRCGQDANKEQTVPPYGHTLRLSLRCRALPCRALPCRALRCLPSRRGPGAYRADRRMHAAVSLAPQRAPAINRSALCRRALFHLQQPVRRNDARKVLRWPGPAQMWPGPAQMWPGPAQMWPAKSA